MLRQPWAYWSSQVLRVVVDQSSAVFSRRAVPLPPRAAVRSTVLMLMVRQHAPGLSSLGLPSGRRLPLSVTRSCRGVNLTWKQRLGNCVGCEDPWIAGGAGSLQRFGGPDADVFEVIPGPLRAR